MKIIILSLFILLNRLNGSLNKAINKYNKNEKLKPIIYGFYGFSSEFIYTFGDYKEKKNYKKKQSH